MTLHLANAGNQHDNNDDDIEKQIDKLFDPIINILKSSTLRRMAPANDNQFVVKERKNMPNKQQSHIVDVSYKVLILGDSRIGKTSIIKRLANNEFREQTISTVGLDFINLYYEIDNLKVRLQVWDTAGQESYRSITRNYFRNTKGIVLVFDITDMKSFLSLNYWIDNLSTMNLDKEIAYLVGNKIDLDFNRQVAFDDGQKLANLNSIKYFETSAKTGMNLQDIFYNIAVDILESNDMKKMERYQNTTLSPKLNTSEFPYNYNIEPVIQVHYNNKLKDKKRIKIKKVYQQQPQQQEQPNVSNYGQNNSTNKKKRKLSKVNRTLNITKPKRKHRIFKSCCTIS